MGKNKIPRQNKKKHKKNPALSSVVDTTCQMAQDVTRVWPEQTTEKCRERKKKKKRTPSYVLLWIMNQANELSKHALPGCQISQAGAK